MYESEITSKMLHSNNNIIIEPSFAQIENLIDGRLSFRGMNPEIERLMELEQGTVQRRAEEAEQLRKMKTDVTDSDMLKFYSNLDNTMKDKFTRGKHQKRQRPADQAATLFHAKKGKFMKPRDDD
jgi:M-phase phosphoprotein 6, animal type